VGHELGAPGGLHLDEERLALVQGHAARLPHRLAAPVLGTALLVEGMPGLVQDAHEGADEIALVVAGGDPHVARGSAAERVQAHVEAPAAEVEARRPHQGLADAALDLGRERAVERPHRRQTLLMVPRRLDHLGQARAQVREDRVDPGLAQAGIVAVEEGVVGRKSQRLPLGGADLPLQREHLGEMGPSACRSRSRAAPRATPSRSA
jgi:hypothetical protein